MDLVPPSSPLSRFFLGSYHLTKSFMRRRSTRPGMEGSGPCVLIASTRVPSTSSQEGKVKYCDRVLRQSGHLTLGS